MNAPILEATEEKLERVRSYFRGDLLVLRETLLKMASLSHTNLQLALESLVERSAEKANKPLLDIPRMGADVLAMIRGATDAFVEITPEKCAEIIKMDVRVDDINRQLERELTCFMVESPKTITRALNLMLVARFFERAADHAKNIAEQVYYLYTGQDIRHESEFSKV